MIFEKATESSHSVFRLYLLSWSKLKVLSTCSEYTFSTIKKQSRDFLYSYHIIISLKIIFFFKIVYETFQFSKAVNWGLMILFVSPTETRHSNIFYLMCSIYLLQNNEKVSGLFNIIHKKQNLFFKLHTNIIYPATLLDSCLTKSPCFSQSSACSLTSLVFLTTSASGVP